MAWRMEPRSNNADTAADFIESMVPLHDAWLADCPDGIQPFDRWTAELVALWTVVHRLSPGSRIQAALDAVRSIGNTQ
jgi:hypothetical protein